MTELSANTIDTKEVSNDSEQAFDVFKLKVAELADLVPEIDLVEGLEEEAFRTIAEYGIQPSLFDTQERALIFTGILAKYLSSESSNPESREIKTNMLTVLAHDYSGALKHAHDHDGGNVDEFDEQARTRAYDAYTDPVLTRELESAMLEGTLLHNVKERLGIDEDNEDPYEIRVLSVAHTDVPYFGLDADRSRLDADFTSDEYDRVQRERQDIIDWKDGLHKRGIDLAKRIGKTELPADAWVSVIDGATTLCISSPFAEKLLDPTLTDNISYYSDSDRARDMAVIEHEYTHTQGGANVDHDIIGVVMEELRAEAFSGNKLGYNDVKSFIGDYAMFTGHDIVDELRSKPKGGTNAELYASIANNIGIDSLVDMVFALPNSYLESEQASESLRSIAKISGGYDGVLTNILEKQLKKGDGGLEARIAEAAKRIAGIFSKPDAVLDIDTYVSIRKRQGVSVGIELVKDYMLEHLPKAG